MKKTKLFAILLFITSLSYSQTWSPIGATWYYDVYYAFEGNIDYHKVYCDSIININGKDCKRINIDYCACNNHFCQKLYTYDVNDTIYFFNNDVGVFEMLYNFNATQGDSWKIRTKDLDNVIDTITLHVDSVGSMIINGKTLKKLYIKYEYFYDRIDKHYRYSEVIQCLGDYSLLINITEKYVGFCDIDFIYSLRCYEDAELGFYTTEHRDSCNYVYDPTSINSYEKTEYLVAYPNPVFDTFTILSNYNDELYYEIYNPSGLIIKHGTESKINLSSFQSGIYFLRLRINNNITKTLKVIKL